MLTMTPRSKAKNRKSFTHAAKALFNHLAAHPGKAFATSELSDVCQSFPVASLARRWNSTQDRKITMAGARSLTRYSVDDWKCPTLTAHQFEELRDALYAFHKADEQCHGDSDFDDDAYEAGQEALDQMAGILRLPIMTMSREIEEAAAEALFKAAGATD